MLTMTEPVRTIDVLEFAPSPGRVDPATGVAYGVRLVLPRSSGSTPASLRTMIAKLSGARVFVDHVARAGEEPKLATQVGWLQNIVESAGTLRADVHLLVAHPLARQLLEVLNRRPNLLQLRISDDGIAIGPSIGPSRSVFESHRGPDEADFEAAYQGIHNRGSLAPPRPRAPVADSDLAVLRPGDCRPTQQDKAFDEAFSRMYEHIFS